MDLSSPDMKRKVCRSCFELICGCLPLVLGIILLASKNTTAGIVLTVWGAFVLFIVPCV